MLETLDGRGSYKSGGKNKKTQRQTAQLVVIFSLSSPVESNVLKEIDLLCCFPPPSHFIFLVGCFISLFGKFISPLIVYIYRLLFWSSCVNWCVMKTTTSTTTGISIIHSVLGHTGEGPWFCLICLTSVCFHLLDPVVYIVALV